LLMYSVLKELVFSPAQMPIPHPTRFPVHRSIIFLRWVSRSRLTPTSKRHSIFTVYTSNFF
jgi:hypothetical protein